MMTRISPLQVRDYFVESFHLDTNLDFKTSGETSGEPELALDFDFKKSENRPIFRVDLEVLVNRTDESFSKAPYRIRIKTQTVLEFISSFPEKDIPRLLGPNGLSMAYGVARGIVGQATGIAPHGKFILPTLNFIEILRDKLAVAEKTKKKTFRKKR